MVDENDRVEDRGDDSKDIKFDYQREISDDQIYCCLNVYYFYKFQIFSCKQFFYKFEMVWILKKKLEERVEILNRMYCIVLGMVKFVFVMLFDNFEFMIF